MILDILGYFKNYYKHLYIFIIPIFLSNSKKQFLVLS